MAHKVPIWFLGRNLTTVSITPMTAGSDGTLTAGSVVSLVGQLDEVTLGLSNQTEMIQAMDIRQANYVAVTSEEVVGLVEILKNGMGLNLLAAASVVGTDYYQVIATRGGNTWTYYGIFLNYEEGLMRGKSAGRMNLQPVSLSDISTMVYS